MTTRAGILQNIARNIQSKIWYQEIKTAEALTQAIRLEVLKNLIGLTDPDEDSVDTVKDACDRVIYDLKGWDIDCDYPVRSAKIYANEAWYDAGTPEDVQELLMALKISKDRVRISFGDPRTKVVDWTETGYVSRSMGFKPIFILVNNKRSTGGGAISTARVLAIHYSNKKMSVFPIYTRI